MPKTVKTIVKIAVTLAFFWVLLSFVRANELLGVFARVDWLWFAISFAVTLAMMAIGCAKWKTVLDLKEQRLSAFELMKIYAIGVFFSNILPSTFGGDVVRAYYVGKLIDNQPYAAVSVFVERFSGAVFLLFLVAFAPLLQPSLFLSPYLYVPAVVGLCAGLTIVWMFFSDKPLLLATAISRLLFQGVGGLSRRRGFTFLAGPLRVMEALYGKVLGTLGRIREEMRVAATAIRSDGSFVARLLGLTLLFYVFSWLNVYSAFKAFGVEVNLLAIGALVPAIMIVAQVPVTLLGNLGYFESVFVFYFLLVGVAGAETLAMGLLLRFKLLCVGGIGFVVYMFYKRRYRLPPDHGENAA